MVGNTHHVGFIEPHFFNNSNHKFLTPNYMHLTSCTLILFYDEELCLSKEKGLSHEGFCHHTQSLFLLSLMFDVNGF